MGDTSGDFAPHDFNEGTLRRVGKGGLKLIGKTLN
jgi:hypothetical protein